MTASLTDGLSYAHTNPEFIVHVSGDNSRYRWILDRIRRKRSEDRIRISLAVLSEIQGWLLCPAFFGLLGVCCVVGSKEIFRTVELTTTPEYRVVKNYPATTADSSSCKPLDPPHNSVNTVNSGVWRPNSDSDPPEYTGTPLSAIGVNSSARDPGPPRS